MKKVITDEQKLVAIKADLIQQVQAGLITAQRAQELYNNQIRIIKSARKNRQAKNIMVLIGSILIGLGIILLGFYNWATLSQTVKLSVAVSWLVLVQIIFYFTIIKKVFFKNHPEAVAALYALSVGGSIILTSNTYPLTYNVANGLLTWLLLILPTIYLAQSISIATIYSIVLIFWATYEWNQSFVLIIWLLIAMILPFTYKMLEKRSYSVHIFSTILAMSTIVAFVVSMMDYWQGFSFQVLTVFIAMIFLFSNTLKIRNYLLERISFLAVLAINLLLTFSASWYEFMGTNVVKTMPSNTLLIVYLAITAVMLFLVNRIHLLGRLNLELTIIALTPFSIGLATVAIFYKVDALYSMGIISLYLICLALGTAYDGLKANSSSTLNKGLSVLTLLIIVRFFDSQMSFQSRAMAFIAVGILFIASNWFLRYRSRQDKTSEEIASNLFDEDSFIDSSVAGTSNLVIDIDDALKQVQTLKKENTQPQPKVSENAATSTPNLPLESTITVKNLDIIATDKDSAPCNSSSTHENTTTKDSAKSFFAPKILKTPSSPVTSATDLTLDSDLPQEKTQSRLPILENKITNSPLLPKETTTTMENFGLINPPKKPPTGNVKIISDNTAKIPVTDTQRFKNLNEIKKNLE